MAPCQLAVLWLRVISPCYYVWVWPLLVSLPALAVAVLVPTPRAFAVLWPMAGAPRCVGRAIRASSNKHLACSGVCRTPFFPVAGSSAAGGGSAAGAAVAEETAACLL
jgi:hypothetical protein